MMTQKSRIITMAFLLLNEEEASEYKTYKTPKISCLVQSWSHWREGKVCYQSLFKEPLVIKFCHHVFSYHGYKLSSTKCNISSNKYKVSSKIIISFHFVVGNMLQAIDHVKIMLQHCSRVKIILLHCCNNIFLVTSSKNLFKALRVTCTVFFFFFLHLQRNIM